MSSPGSSGAPRLHRRTYVIDRGFQLKYTLILIVVGAVVSALFGGMMYLAHVDAARTLAPALRGQLGRAEENLLVLTAAMSVLMAAALGLFGVLITHRVAGPVYVMSHYVSVLAKGRYPLMRPLRKRDELKGFFDRFQEAIESLRQREADEAKTLDGLISELRGRPGELQKVIAELESLRDRKRDATDRVDVGGGAQQKSAA